MKRLILYVLGYFVKCDSVTPSQGVKLLSTSVDNSTVAAAAAAAAADDDDVNSVVVYFVMK